MGNIDMRFKGNVCLELLSVGVSGAALPVLEGFLRSRDLRNQHKLIGGQQLLSSSHLHLYSVALQECGSACQGSVSAQADFPMAGKGSEFSPAHIYRARPFLLARVQE